jgi:hypothetical protein
VRRGASWTTAYHRQLTVAAAASPIRGRVGALGVLAVERSWLLLAQTTSARRSVQPVSRRSGVVAVVDTASRHATASVAAVQQAVSTHPVSASGIRLFSRPVSGHLGSSSRGPALGRLLSTRPVSSRLLSTRAVSSCLVSSRLVSAPSVRTRPSPPMLKRWRWGLRSRRSGDRDHRNRWGPRWLPGRRWFDRWSRGRDAATLARSRWSLGGRGGPGPPGWVRAAAAALAR